jgi:hypothetical protein
MCITYHSCNLDKENVKSRYHGGYFMDTPTFRFTQLHVLIPDSSIPASIGVFRVPIIHLSRLFGRRDIHNSRLALGICTDVKIQQ